MTKRKQDTSPKPPAASRSRTRERRVERQKQKKRQQQIAIAVGLAVVAILIVIMFIIANQPASAPIPDNAIARYEGIPQDRTVEGYARLGRPDAPVRVEEFSSFSCPGCASFHDTEFDGVIDLVREGKISFTFVPQLTGSIRNPEGAARAAFCAGEQGRFFEYHDALFDWHRRYGNQAFSQNRLLTGAENMGLNRSQFESCLSSSRYADVISTAQTAAASRGVPGTPATYVNGVAVSSTSSAIRTAVDEAIAFSGAVPIPLSVGTSQPETTPEVEVTQTVDDAAIPAEEATPEAESESSGG